MRIRHRSPLWRWRAYGPAALALMLNVALAPAVIGQEGDGGIVGTPTIPVATSVLGTSTLIGQVQAGSVSVEGGVVRTRDNVLLTAERTSDARTSGQARITVNVDAYQNAGDGPAGLQVRFGTMRLVNEDGAWEGRFTGRLNEAGFAQTYWLIGEGAYEGLTYVVTAFGSGPVWTSSGLIYPGAPPEGIPRGLLDQDLPRLPPLALR